MEKAHVCRVFVYIITFLVAFSQQTCPPNINQHIGKCVCSQKTGAIVCKNEEAPPNRIGLKSSFRSMADFITENKYDKLFPSLLIVESRDVYEALIFDEIQFNSVEIFETNLTTIEKSVFNMMNESLKYLHIKSKLLQSFSKALEPLINLETLYLTLGLKSLSVLRTNEIANLPKLDAVLIDGVVHTIESNAFHSLPLLERVRITNQVETIQRYAFNLTANELSNTVIDLSGNRLSETSFEENFIVSKQGVSLILSGNKMKALPESIFMSFLDANSDNKIYLDNNPFVCGRCDSEWTVKRFNSQRIVGLRCANNPAIDPWKYAWGCKTDEKPGNSANLLRRHSNILLLAAVLFITFVFISV